MKLGWPKARINLSRRRVTQGAESRQLVQQLASAGRRSTLLCLFAKVRGNKLDYCQGGERRNLPKEEVVAASMEA